jgi:hypothetical protein
MRKFVFILLCAAACLPVLSVCAAASGKQAAASTRSTASKTAQPTSATAKKTSTTRKRRRASTKFVPKQKAPTADRITEIQTALARGGYYQGDPNGKWDSSTVAAMQKFQSSNGIDPTGKIDAPSLQKLGLGSDIAGVSAPRPPAPAGSSPSSAPAAPPAASTTTSSASSSAATAAAIAPTAGLSAKAPQK